MTAKFPIAKSIWIVAFIIMNATIIAFLPFCIETISITLGCVFTSIAMSAMILRLYKRRIRFINMIKELSTIPSNIGVITCNLSTPTEQIDVEKMKITYGKKPDTIEVKLFRPYLYCGFETNQPLSIYDYETLESAIYQIRNHVLNSKTSFEYNFAHSVSDIPVPVFATIAVIFTLLEYIILIITTDPVISSRYFVFGLGFNICLLLIFYQITKEEYSAILPEHITFINQSLSDRKN